eukprot:15440660-Alexandrium_andersonii.AAC.1
MGHSHGRSAASPARPRAGPRRVSPPNRGRIPVPRSDLRRTGRRCPWSVRPGISPLLGSATGGTPCANHPCRHARARPARKCRIHER